MGYSENSTERIFVMDDTDKRVIFSMIGTAFIAIGMTYIYDRIDLRDKIKHNNKLVEEMRLRTDLATWILDNYQEMPFSEFMKAYYERKSFIQIVTEEK
jgi:hypothetical protein